MRADVTDQDRCSKGWVTTKTSFGNMATRMKVQHCDDWCGTVYRWKKKFILQYTIF